MRTKKFVFQTLALLIVATMVLSACGGGLPTATETPTLDYTATASPTPSNTSTPTATSTLTPTASVTASPIPTARPTRPACCYLTWYFPFARFSSTPRYAAPY